MHRRQREGSLLLPVALAALAPLAVVGVFWGLCAAGAGRSPSLLAVLVAFLAVLPLSAALAMLFARNRKLRAQVARLRWSEERYRVLAEASDEVFWEYDIDGDAFSVSENFSRLYSREGARTFDEFLQNVHPDDRKQYEEEWRGFRAGRDIPDAIADIRLRRGADEPPRYAWCRVRMRTVRNTSGRRRAVVGKLTDISQERLHAERLETRARTDGLTGLLNRAGLEEAIRARLSGRRRDPCAVLILDIDLFKQVNDFYGHDVGDQALRAMGDFLRAHFRESDIVGRLGGDEFIALIDGTDSAARLELALSRLRANLSGVRIPNTPRALSASIGAALFPKNGDSFEALYHNADIALYEAKRSGTGGYALFDERMRRPDAPRAIRTPANVYVLRAGTHDLLFANAPVRRKVPTLEIGRRCHVQFMRLDEPCDNCPATACAALGRDRYACDFFSPYLNGWMRASVSRVRWRDGSDAYVLKCREILPTTGAGSLRDAAQ